MSAHSPDAARRRRNFGNVVLRQQRVMNQKANCPPLRGPCRAILGLGAAVAALAFRLAAAEPAPPSPTGVLQELRSFNTLGSVLMVAGASR